MNTGRLVKFFVLVSLLVLGGAEAAEEVKLEGTEWTRFHINDAKDLKGGERVLLVGDSITNGYFYSVVQRMKGVAVSQVVTSAYAGDVHFVETLKMVLERYRFDVIHLNNGLHGMGYSEREFGLAYGKLVKMIEERGRGARLVMVTSTPILVKGSEKFNVKHTRRIRERNDLVKGIAKASGYFVNDLFGLSFGKPRMYRQDGTHFKGAGVVSQAEQVASVLKKALKAEVSYQTRFEEGDVSWEFKDKGSWKMKDLGGKRGQVLSLFKKKSAYKPEFRSPFHVALLKGRSVQDFVYDVEVKSTHKEYGHRDVCLFFGYQDDAHFYYVHLASKADDHANQIFIVDGAARRKITLKGNSRVKWDGKFHHVRIKRDVKSGRIAVYFDDMNEPAMVAEDKTFGWGRVGVGSFDDTADFDGVAVRGE